jgi:hypothetical protein
MADAARRGMSVRHSLAFCLAAICATQSAYADVDERVRMDQYEHHRHRRSDQDWVTLATPTPSRNGTEFIVVGRQAGWFRTLRIEAVSGRVFVRKLDVYSGRFRRSYRLDAWLDASHPTLYVDLGKPWLIDQLAVTTARWTRGAYSVQGSSGTVPRSRIVSER